MKHLENIPLNEVTSGHMTKKKRNPTQSGGVWAGEQDESGREGDTQLQLLYLNMPSGRGGKNRLGKNGVNKAREVE